MNTYELVVEIRPDGPEFFPGLIATTTSLVFIAARISYNCSRVHVSVGISMSTACSVTHKLFVIFAAPRYV